jgi:hypothetical protein
MQRLQLTPVSGAGSVVPLPSPPQQAAALLGRAHFSTEDTRISRHAASISVAAAAADGGDGRSGHLSVVTVTAQRGVYLQRQGSEAVVKLPAGQAVQVRACVCACVGVAQGCHNANTLSKVVCAVSHPNQLIAAECG